MAFPCSSPCRHWKSPACAVGQCEGHPMSMSMSLACRYRPSRLNIIRLSDFPMGFSTSLWRVRVPFPSDTYLNEAGEQDSKHKRNYSAYGELELITSKNKSGRMLRLDGSIRFHNCSNSLHLENSQKIVMSFHKILWFFFEININKSIWLAYDLLETKWFAVWCNVLYLA